MNKGIKLFLGFGFALGGLFAFAAGSEDSKDNIPFCIGGVFVMISAAMFVLAFRTKKPSPCPVCSNTQRKAVSKEEKLARGTFQVLPIQKCASCGHLWEPSAPRWLLFVGAAAGLFFIVAGISFLLDAFTVKGRPLTDSEDSSIATAFLFLAIGGATVAGCARRLLKPKVVGRK